MSDPKRELDEDVTKSVSGGLTEPPPEQSPLGDTWKALQDWWKELIN